MAIIVSDSRNPSYDGNISTVNGFYRAEVSNLACSYTAASLTSTVNIPVTFANAGKCMGVALWLTIAYNSTCNRPIKVELQELVGGTTWTARTSQTLTAAQIFAGSGASNVQEHSQGYITGFKFDTPYAVNTTAGIWRFQITSTAGTGNWNTRMAAAGVYSIVSWCDNAISFTSNQDQFVAIDKIVLDSAVTLLGALQPGDTVNQICGWIGSSQSTYADEDACMLTWDDAPASSYKVTVTGRIYYGSNGGFRAGTDTVPIPASAMGHLEFTAATLGTNNNSLGSGFFNHNAGASVVGSGLLFLYGEVPKYEDTRLAADAAQGQKVIVTQDVTGWVAGDRLVIGGCDTKGNTDPTVYEIESVAGDGVTITLTTNLGNKRWSGRSVVRLNGYGFKMSATNTNGLIHRCYTYNRWVMRGVEFVSINWQTAVNAPFLTPQPWSISHCSCNCDFTYGGAFLAHNFLYGGQYTVNPTTLGTYIDHVNVFNGHIASAVYVGNGAGPLSITNCIIINPANKNERNLTTAGSFTYSNNRHYHSTISLLKLQGFQSIFENNEFWGMSGGGSSGNGGVNILNFFNATKMGGNKFDNCAVAINLSNSGPSLGNISRQDEFGQQVANTIDLYMVVAGLHQLELENFKGNLSTYWWQWLYHGTQIRLTKANQVEGADSILYEEGAMYKCGDGLSDTTKHVQTYSLKFVSKADVGGTVPAQTPIYWKQKIPTENIQNKDMMVGVWMKIASSDFWTTAGTSQMPRLIVNYDNGTTAYGEAAQTTDWQFVFVPFTPLTTYGEIEVTISGQSQAALANAAFYVAEMSVLYPAGHNIEMGKFNTWSSSLPTMPSISTTISAGDVWAVDPASFGANTVGDKINKTKNDTGLIPALL